MMMPILTYPDRILAQCSNEVTQFTPEISTLAQDMLETMYAKEGIGLAAPQVGVLQRLIVVDVTGPERREDPRILVNPVILSASGQTESNEGCLSVINLRSKVQRAERIQVQAMDIEGRQAELEVDGMLAICLQHEIDHLNGILFIDRISRLKRSLYEQKLKKWTKIKQTHSD
ncbi:MAG TPA: peptide deformylase [Desulfonatronum sp.]|nr:peptide deformylase [Desulfonatronum sp.]